MCSRQEEARAPCRRIARGLPAVSRGGLCLGVRCRQRPQETPGSASLIAGRLRRRSHCLCRHGSAFPGFSAAGGWGRLLLSRGFRLRLIGRLRFAHWVLAGEWAIGRETVVLDRSGGSIAYRFHARISCCLPERESPLPCACSSTARLRARHVVAVGSGVCAARGGNRSPGLRARHRRRSPSPSMPTARPAVRGPPAGASASSVRRPRLAGRGHRRRTGFD